MRNLTETYQNIADILSFKKNNSDLESHLKSPLIDWDAIVIQGSKHLVLPAIYCRLLVKKLTHVLPSELNTYLKEITELNRNRNELILKQILSLSQLLNEHKINYVFLKGSALLISNLYTDKGERMIGDIDILIPKQQLNQAFKLLKNHSYTPAEHTLGDDFFEHKHLPRLKTNKFICAVELHRKLFMDYADDDLRSTNIFKEKQTQHNICIPSFNHLLKHNILNFQVNDNGNLYNNINFRSAYDTILLIKTKGLKPLWYNEKIIKDYNTIINLFFADTNGQIIDNQLFAKKFYLYKLKHPRFYKIWNRIITLKYNLKLILNRIKFFCTNNAYRKAIIKDRKRITKRLTLLLKGS
ncbi:nucleotidyltransferase family protein [uncultured Winogradskyella sp.]|uniref:nucleotidyltransferase family protein n=1 Tax=uncultured Winogradskyella sp. TaxID=395353 RepID=UPI00260A7509|nr:nucleotidyltransferase family protein [uncultured Winogradskyella sp.]